jgi:glycosyltransferase involved in cell wall biosynthesis
MRSPLVSILIPTFNAAPWLAKTLESALTQTWGHLEVIVVDDGSTDDSLSIAKSFSCERLRLISQPNSGSAAARNTALKAAKGDYLQYLDADDLFSPDKIRAQLMTLEACPPETLGVTGTIYFQDGQAPEAGNKAEGWPMIDSDNTVEWLIGLYGGNDGHGSMVHPGAWLIPRGIAEAAGYWCDELSCIDDGEYFSRVVLASKRIRVTSGVFSLYRKHAVRQFNLSNAKTRAVLLGTMHSLDRMSAQLLSRTTDPRAKRGLARLYVERAISSYPYCVEASDHGLLKAKELYPAFVVPSLKGWSEVIRKLLGWKLARRISALREHLH